MPHIKCLSKIKYMRKIPLLKTWRNNREWRKKPIIRLIMADAQLGKPHFIGRDFLR
jgi:hypothetical protein